MENQPRQLGLFAKLPLEIRFQIWEHLFSSINNDAQDPHRDHRPVVNNLPIRYASRYLYHEITHHLCAGLTHTVRLPEFHLSVIQPYMIEAEISSNRLSATWILENWKDVRGYLENFHLDEARLTIVEIPAPMLEDPGQLVRLWQLAKGLARLMQSLSVSQRPRLLVKLTQCWQKKGNANQCLQISGAGERPDHDILISPFTCLAAKWRYKYDVPEDLRAVVLAESSPNKSLLYCFMDERSRLLSDPFHPIDERSLPCLGVREFCFDTAVFIDMSIDNMPGMSAGWARRDRFIKWFDDRGTSWRAAYEEWILSVRSANGNLLGGNDEFLRKASQRHRILILLHHLANVVRAEGTLAKTRKVFEETSPPRLYTTWDPDTWRIVFPCGLPPLDDTCVGALSWLRQYESSTYAAYKRGMEQVSRFSDAIQRRIAPSPHMLTRNKQGDYECRLCDEQDSQCWYCREYNYSDLCWLCRCFNQTGWWPSKPSNGGNVDQ